MSSEASVFQLEACIPGTLSFALEQAIGAGVESVPPNFADYRFQQRRQFLDTVLSLGEETREQFLGRLARKAADQLLPPTQLMLEGEAEAGSRLAIVSTLPEVIVEATCEGIEAMTDQPIDWIWGDRTADEVGDLTETLREIRSWGYSLRTLVRGPQDWRRAGSVQLQVEHLVNTSPGGITQVFWHPQSETMRVQHPDSNDHFFHENVLYEPEAKRKFRELLGHQKPGRILD